MKSSSELNSEPPQDPYSFILSYDLVDLGLSFEDETVEFILPILAAENLLLFKIWKYFCKYLEKSFL